MRNKFGRAVTLGFWISTTFGLAQAAEKVHWEDLLHRYGGSMTCPSGMGCDGKIDHRSISVTTLDGVKHHTRTLLIAPDHMRLYDSHNRMTRLPREAIARVEIRQIGSHFHHILGNLAFAEWIAEGLPIYSDGGSTNVFALVLSTPFWAYTVASMPVFLLADGIALFRPVQVFKIVV